jgi:hypothetical protein
VAHHVDEPTLRTRKLHHHQGRGLTEVGAMIMTGRRVALLKDGSIEKMPTDFVGMIYKSVDLEDFSTVRDRVKDWLKDDLRIGKL